MTLKTIIMPLHIFKELPLDWARLSIDIEGTKRLILEFLVIKCKMDKIKKKKKNTTDYGLAVWIWWHCIMSSGTKAQPNICVIAIPKKGSLEMKNPNIEKQFL